MMTEIEKIRQNICKQKISTQSKCYDISSQVYFCTLGNGALENPNALLIVTDWNCYMFNCGEGTQRLANEHKVKLSKLKHIFLTHNKWQNIGGIPGLALTIQDIGVSEIVIHGPNYPESLFDLSKNFIYLNKLNIINYPENTFETNILKIESVPIQPKSKSENTNKRIKLDLSETYVYIGAFHQTPGHVNMDKCKELKIPKGPLIGKLKKGEDVQLPSGTIVKPVQVLTSGEPKFVFIVVECPSVEYISALVENERISQCQDSKDISDCAGLVIHFTPREVVFDCQYQNWVATFPPLTRHMFLNAANPSLSNLSIHRIQTILHMLHPKIFPPLRENNIKLEGQVETLTKFYIRPRKGLQDNKGLDLKPEIYKEEILSNLESQRRLDELRCKLNCEQNGATSGYPETVFLGTGSAIPCKVRNVSSVLVTLNPGQRFLLDCGEGTLGQLCRFFGESELDAVLSEIQIIFVSHLHADHHLGLFSLLLARKKALHKLGRKFSPLNLLAPQQILPWLHGYNQHFEAISDTYRLIYNTTLLYSKHSLTSQALEHLLDIQEIQTVNVLHCPNAFGIVLTSSIGHKIVYSGDTMPSDDLIQAGLNCHLLIHEATMEDDLAEDALKKTHTTTSQALDVGKKMNAQFTILTHFSQRYAKIPLFNNNFHSNVGVAFDNMRIWPAVYPLLAQFIPVLKTIFAEHYEQMQEKTAKKQSKAASATFESSIEP